MAPTQLLVVVDSDLFVPSELGSVRVVTRRNDSTVSQIDFTVGLSSAAATQVLPFSFGVVPTTGGDLSERVRVTLQALDALGDVVVEQSAQVGFISGRTLLLPMFLLRSCRAVVCGPGLTCTRAGCVSEWVSAGELTVIVPGTELAYDAAPRLDGSDAGSLDAGFFDAGLFDAGFVDVGADASDVSSRDVPADGPIVACTACGMGRGCDCPDGARCECSSSCACHIGCGAGEACTVDCRGASMCNVDVRRSARATVYCGGVSTCEVEARDAGEVAAFCGGNATCVVDCSGVSNCMVACTGSAACEVDCSRTTTCEFTACSGGEASCPGDVITCNRPCP